MEDREGFFWEKGPRKELEKAYQQLADPRTEKLPVSSGNRSFRRVVQNAVDKHGINNIEQTANGSDPISFAIRAAIAWLRESGGYSGDFADSLTMTRAQRVASIYLRS